MTPSRTDRVFVGITLTVCLVQGLVGIAKYGYCGQDFDYHYSLLTGFPRTFSYAYTNPPGLYALGWVAGLVSRTWILEITAVMLVVLNTAALWLLSRILTRIIVSPELRYAAILLAAFVPFRVVHAVVLASDALTVPVFVAVAWYAIRLFERPEQYARTWAIVGALVTAGLLIKYTFVGLLPALALVAVHQIATAAPARRRPIAAAAAIGLLVPSLAFLTEMGLSRRAHGVTTVTQWIGPGEAPEMTIGDLLGVKARDVEILGAPQYFQDRIYEPHKYSYLGLMHLAAFTDVMNFFQQPADLARHRTDHAQGSNGFPRTRRVQARSRIAVAAALPFTLAALAGTCVFAIAAVARLVVNRGAAQPLAVLTVLALGFYAPIVTGITRMVGAYGAGYWLPRLVMPSLVTFLVLGIALLDRLCGRVPAFTGTWLVYTTAACLLFISIT